ncbi:hypothetical protein T07_1535 [Trichinella nelsoni]|uniref:Uncharacterized protein n=1 Tax=Trichinella nelsoni TaxID=6336 RepID=A0A0V0RX51_9BILA|nr:hypothetical protein T07_1535 [Trichinella nelsoni]
MIPFLEGCDKQDDDDINFFQSSKQWLKENEMTNISVCRQLFAVISLLVIHLLLVFEENLVSVDSTHTQRKH